MASIRYLDQSIGTDARIIMVSHHIHVSRHLIDEGEYIAILLQFGQS